MTLSVRRAAASSFLLPRTFAPATSGEAAPARTGGRRPRLIIVGPLPPPIGGVETFTQAILESPAFAPFDVFHCDTTKQRPKATQGRFDAGNFVWAARHFLRLALDCARIRPDVVYLPIAGTWSGFLRDMGLGWIARRSGARVIGHQHAGDVPDVLARRGASGRVVRGGLAQFHRLLVLGERWRTLFADYGLTIPCEICPSTFRREVFERGLAFTRAPAPGGRALRLLYVGQIGRRKGVHDLLHATRRLRDRGVEAELTLVGPSQLEGESEAAARLARELALGDSARLTGALEGEALYEMFRTHDVFVLPSHNEGLPAVLYEAGAFEMPVVTTPVGAIPDLMRDGENGLLAPPGDVDALAAAILRLAEGPELRARLGAALKRDVAEFHPDRVSERIVRAVRAELAA